VVDGAPIGEFSESVDETDADRYVPLFAAPDAKVLVVDDNEMNLQVIRGLLRNLKLQLTLVTSGKECLEQLDKESFHVLLLDHMMPDPDGMETLKLIKNEPDSLNKDTKVIVLTANAVSGSKEMYMAAGFTDYLVKPIDSKKLVRTVKKYLPEDKMYIKQENDKAASSSNDGNTELQSNDSKTVGSLKERLLSVLPDMDYDNALAHCAGDEDVLSEILTDVSNACAEKINDLKGYIKSEDYKDYLINVHALKGNMATVGLMKLSERAKKHEFAAKEDNISFILKDFEGFIAEYKDACERIAGCVKG
ncbi:MAG: response regulator, partial [Lachnospiraceae bacterium]|nr:response regulator [Lachnospiraceae bacterium]